MLEDSAEVIRERLVRNGIEETERRYVKFVAEKGKEPAVFIFNLLDQFGREFAESWSGKEEVDRRVRHASPDEITPVFHFLCSLEDAAKMMSTGEFALHGQVPGLPIPPGMFLVIGVSHGGMLLRWLPKPE